MDYTIARKKGSGAIVWSEDQIRYIIEEYTVKDRTLKELSEEFKVQPQSIRNLLRKQKIEITNKKIKNYPRNSNYFEKIDTPDKAYWLGMMFSDGSITKERQVNLELKDEEHILKFQKAIGAKNHKINIIKDQRWSKECVCYKLGLRDQKLAEDLKKYGCVPNKSYIQFDFPNIPEEFYPDFIRGYFDGDGSVYFTNNKYKLSFVGNDIFLISLKKILNKPNLTLCQSSVSKITYDLKICGKKDVIRILHYMYDNSTPETRLDRKYLLVQKCFNSYGA